VTFIILVWHTFFLAHTFLLFLGIFTIARFLFRTSLAFTETLVLPGKSVCGRLFQLKEREC